MMALEEHTGAAKTSALSKKKEIYEERRIAVFLGGLDLMTVSAGEPELLYGESVFHSIGETHFHRKYSENKSWLA